MAKDTLYAYGRIAASLGENAEITAIWLQSVTVKAKKSWQLSFDTFRRSMRKLLERKNVNLNGYVKLLKGFWYGDPVILA